MDNNHRNNRYSNWMLLTVSAMTTPRPVRMQPLVCDPFVRNQPIKKTTRARLGSGGGVGNHTADHPLACFVL